MAGQDACLSLKEARAQQERTCANEHQGPTKSSSTSAQETTAKAKHQG